MLSKNISLGIHGIQAVLIEIEVDIIKGLPNLTIVGLPDSTIRESKDRIRSAIENSGFEFPPKNFIVNLAPASFKKQGAFLDLPIALSILNATNQINIINSNIPMVGELSLDGTVKPVNGILSMAITLYQNNFTSMIVPYENRNEASVIKELKIYPVKNICEAINVLEESATPYNYLETKNEELHNFDFKYIKGQESAKRALEIAAAGHHNILLYGPPGSGKTLLAKTLPSILPLLNREQAIETTMIHSVTGNLKSGSGLITIPPFRSPHHTASDVALIGGGTIPKIGEVSLAHNGILFLDEFVEYKNNVIQSLRQPLENSEITISRAFGTFVFPADFMLVAASNPCQCGYLFDDEITCSCPHLKVKNYFQKISGPILDRIDIEILVNKVSSDDLLHKNLAEDSHTIKKRILKAREIQAIRFKKNPNHFNSQMSNKQISYASQLTKEAETILKHAIDTLNLSARSFYKIIKVARTIADLDESNDILEDHIFEAISYKNLQKNYNLF